MAKDKKINRMFITLWFSFLLKGMEIIQDVKSKRRNQVWSLPHGQLEAELLLTCLWSLELPIRNDPRDHCTVSKTEFHHQLCKTGHSFTPCLPSSIFLHGLHGARVRGEERNILLLLFRIYSSWPTKKQHFLTARPVRKDSFMQPSSLEALQQKLGKEN